MRKQSLLFLVVGFTGMLLGCASNPHVPVVENRSTTPQALLVAGNRLGVDFSTPLLFEQSKCQSDPFAVYSEKKYMFGGICFNTKTYTDVFWVRNHISPDLFVRTNAEKTARENNIGLNSVTVDFEKLEGSKYYYRVLIGSATSFQGVFFIPTQKGRELKLEVGVLVRGPTLKVVEDRLTVLKEEVKNKN